MSFNPFRLGANRNTLIPALSQYERIQEIEEGSEGYVEAWRNSRTGSLIAVKVVSRLRPVGELTVLLNLMPHTHIMDCLGYIEGQPSPRDLTLLLEYCPGGDLFQVQSRNLGAGNDGTFSEEFMWSVYVQLAAAMAYLHEGINMEHPWRRSGWRTILHRDLKAENVLVKRMGVFDDMSDIHVKLGDFGGADYYRPFSVNPESFGTPMSWPPEMIERRMELTTTGATQYAPPCDVWGIGAIMHNLAHTFHPIVTPYHLRDVWTSQGNVPPYPSNWPESRTWNYWAARVPRRVVPINLPTDTVPELMGFVKRSPTDLIDVEALFSRDRRPSPKYSDQLNHCLMLALNMDPLQRVRAGELFIVILEKHTNLLIETRPPQYTEHLRDLVAR